MLKLKEKIGYFSKSEITLWCSSVVLIVLAFCVFDRENYLTLIASLVGSKKISEHPMAFVMKIRTNRSESLKVLANPTLPV